MPIAQPAFCEPLAPGQRLGPFLLLAPLGSGGSGRVWAVARIGQLGFSKRMALKVMRADKVSSERARLRFDREALWGAQLRHPHLRAVHDLGSHEGQPYMAMAWVDASFSELLEQLPDHRVEPRLACWLGVQACAALAAAHARAGVSEQPLGIVHGDISPGNILLAKNGHVQLADLAAMAEPSPQGAQAGRATRPFFGSLGYASPEALRCSALDGRADLFSLGCVLYEALTGCAAFEGDDERAVMFQVLEQSPLDIRQRGTDVPDSVAEVVQRAMQRCAGDRYSSAEEMGAALASCLSAWSPFELEQAATALIESVLGERMRAREEEMYRVFQRFSASQLAKTETLPIVNSERATGGGTLRLAEASAPQEAPARDASAPVLAGLVRSRGRRRALGAALGLALVLIAAWLGRSAFWSVASTPHGPSPPLELAAHVAGEAEGTRAAPATSAEVTHSPLLPVTPAPPGAPGPREPAPHDPGHPPQPAAGASNAHPPAGRGNGKKPARAETAPGFDFKFPKNPYSGR